MIGFFRRDAPKDHLRATVPGVRVIAVQNDVCPARADASGVRRISLRSLERSQGVSQVDRRSEDLVVVKRRGSGILNAEFDLTAVSFRDAPVSIAAFAA